MKCVAKKIEFCLFLVGDVSFVVVYADEKDKSRGCGTVEFDRAESAQKAIDKMHRYDINGRKLVVKEVYIFLNNLNKMLLISCFELI